MVVRVFLNKLQEIMSEIHTVFKEKYDRYFTINCETRKHGESLFNWIYPRDNNIRNVKETNSNMYNLK